MSVDSKRSFWLDALKVFAISLVVLGHSVQTLNTDYEHHIVFKYIYAFHMPLFMFISGFLSYRDDRGMTFRTVRKRFFQLMVPFICWPILLCLLRGEPTTIPEVLMKLFYQPDRGLWFLYVLFFITLISYGMHALARQCVTSGLLRKMKIKEEIGGEVISFLIVYGLNVLLYMTSYNAYGTFYIVWHLVFFTLGYYVKKHEEWIYRHFTPIFWASLIFYAFNGQFFLLNGHPTFYEYLNCGNIFAYLYKLILGLSGCLATYLFFKRYVRLPENRLVTYIAMNTLGIYAIHQNLFGFVPVQQLFKSEFVQTSVLFGVVFAWALLLVVILSRLKWTAFCLLGKS